MYPRVVGMENQPGGQQKSPEPSPPLRAWASRDRALPKAAPQSPV